MARLRYNGLTATLGASLDAGDTAITFAEALTHSGGTAVPTITGTDYIPLALLDADGALREIVHLTAYTTGATTGTVARAQESTAATTHDITGKAVQGGTVRDAGVRYASLKCSTGTITCSSSSLVVLTNSGGAGTIQVTVPAAAGDLLEIGLNAQSSDGSPTEALDLNVATFVAGVETSRVGGAGTTGSIPSWSVRPSAYWPVDGRACYTVQASDVNSDGTVVLRLMGRVSVGSRSLFSTAAAPLIFSVINVGPVA